MVTMLPWKTAAYVDSLLGFGTDSCCAKYCHCCLYKIVTTLQQQKAVF